MVLCILCGNFERKTRECSAYHDKKGDPAVITIKDMDRQMLCPRYKRKYI